MIGRRWNDRRRCWKSDDDATMLCGGLHILCMMTAAVQSMAAGALIKSMIELCPR